MSEHSKNFGPPFVDVSSVRTNLLDAAFFKGFCTTRPPVSTTYTGKKCVEKLIPAQKLSVKRQQDDKESRVPLRLNYFGANNPIYVFADGCNESYVLSFRISAWGAKRNESCGVLVINFATLESYNNFLNGKSEEYDHLESKCFQVGTNTPLLSSATFYLNKTGLYYYAAKIVDGNIKVDVDVSRSLFRNTPILTTKNITETEYCKYAKQILCSHGLAGQSAVLRYFSSQPMEIDNISVCHAMYDNETLIEFGVVAIPHMYNDYFHPEIIVLESQSVLNTINTIGMILDLMLDPARFISGILLKHKILIICIVIIIVFVLKKTTIYFIYIVFNYCFRFYLFCLLSGYMFGFLLNQFSFDVVLAYVFSFFASIIISHHFMMIVEKLLHAIFKVTSMQFTT